MRYILLSQLYIPIWLIFGFNATGIILNIIVPFAAMLIAWRLEFGTFKFWE
jgi:hypothetical protein